MARRLLSAVARTLRPATPDTPHFHNETGAPTPCFEDRCARPRLYPGEHG